MRQTQRGWEYVEALQARHGPARLFLHCVLVPRNSPELLLFLAREQVTPHQPQASLQPETSTPHVPPSATGFPPRLQDGPQGSHAPTEIGSGKRGMPSVHHLNPDTLSMFLSTASGLARLDHS